MTVSVPDQASRRGVVDLGSNSVRLVVYEGDVRNPTIVFNEKAVLRLGRGLQESGRLNEDGMAQALRVLHRYRAVARAMRANPLEVLATSAVRDARNGPEFVATLGRLLEGVPIHVLSGAQEALMSADGVVCGIPDADGTLVDIGGGSLELVRIGRDGYGTPFTAPLGVLRLADRAGGDLVRANGIVKADLAGAGWLAERPGTDFYLVGGAWRALAHMHMALTRHPLPMIHHYTIPAEAAARFATRIETESRQDLERKYGAPRRRSEDLPYAAIVLRHLIGMGKPRRLVFSATGLREGWLARQWPAGLAARDPLLDAAIAMARLFGRDPALPPALLHWTGPLFPDETVAERRLREAACWMSDIGSHEHPEYRAEQAFNHVLRQPGVGIDHPTRAWLGQAVAMRYEADPDAAFLRPTRPLLTDAAASRAAILGGALRLAYTLSAGTREILAGTALRVERRHLVLSLHEDSGVFAGEAVVRRLERLAGLLGLTATSETTEPLAAD
jgi:exopolyphosphatase/guanosine-5'-triphosphate,3'-diphosphate pyrophosphatase